MNANEINNKLLVCVARIDERTLNLVQKVTDIDFKLENKYAKQEVVDAVIKGIKLELVSEINNQKLQVADLRKICYWAISTAIIELLSILGYVIVKFIQ